MYFSTYTLCFGCVCVCVCVCVSWQHNKPQDFKPRVCGGAVGGSGVCWQHNNISGPQTPFPGTFPEVACAEPGTGPGALPDAEGIHVSDNWELGGSHSEVVPAVINPSDRDPPHTHMKQRVLGSLVRPLSPAWTGKFFTSWAIREGFMCMYCIQWLLTHPIDLSFGYWHSPRTEF